MQHMRIFHVDAAECWKTNPMGLFGGSFAVWPTGNSIDFKICLREKASRQKGGKLDGGDMDGGKRAETFPRATIDAPRREGWKMAGESAASKMCGSFLRHKPCPTTIMKMRHNGDRDCHGYCARFSTSTKSSHFILRSIS